MYAYIKGVLKAVRPDSVVLDNHGIGYHILVPAHFAEGLAAGDEVTAYTHFSVREDAMQLFGFRTEDELELFRLLLSVSGIGPKGALGVLTGMSADELRFAILSDDASSIAKAPGIGRKTAQKIILELKDKLDLEEAFEKKVQLTEEALADGKDSPESEAVLALAALGYPRGDALKAVRKVLGAGTDPLDVEAILKAALREL
ncbi:MAG: Holliday junction branch migration protein RuvA [Lachnospiraceae bacterium]|nr:Holliday junction branch migration protein RuvA [Lachnospiraceae bacterium]